MKYSEAKQQIESLSKKYSTDVDLDGEFDVYYEDALIIYVRPYRYGFGSLTSMSTSVPLFDKAYMIMAELAATPAENRDDEEKFYIKAFDGYLNLADDGESFIYSKDPMDDTTTAFTNKEIDDFKQRQDIPLDWNKVKLEPVRDL